MSPRTKFVASKAAHPAAKDSYKARSRLPALQARRKPGKAPTTKGRPAGRHVVPKFIAPAQRPSRVGPGRHPPGAIPRSSVGRRPHPGTTPRGQARRPGVVIPVRPGTPGRRKDLRRMLVTAQSVPSVKKPTKSSCFTCTCLMWILTAVAIGLIVLFLVLFRHKLFPSGSQSPSNNSGNSSVSELDPEEETRKDDERREEEERQKQREEEERKRKAEEERKRKEAERKRREEEAKRRKKAERQKANNRTLTGSDFGLSSFPKYSSADERIRECENFYRNNVPSSAILKRDGEKLWAVAIILYTNAGGAARKNPDFYAKVNKSLREGGTTYSKYVSVLTDALNYLIEKQTVSVPSTFYRGIALPPSDASSVFKSNCRTFGAGKQFSSVSTSSSAVTRFHDGRDHSGSTYAFLCTITNTKRAARVVEYGLKSETEWLYPPGVTFETSCSGTPGNGLVQVKMVERSSRRRLAGHLRPLLTLH